MKHPESKAGRLAQPKEYGGTGWAGAALSFNEELQMAPAPAPLAFGVSMVGLIYTFGNGNRRSTICRASPMSALVVPGLRAAPAPTSPR